MKKISVIFFILFFISTHTLAEVYYCTDQSRTGFLTANNFKSTNFKLQRFTVDIDLVNLDITSDDLFFVEPLKHTCHMDRSTNSFNCMNKWGTVFSYNTISKRYFLGFIFNKTELTDDNSISTGQCEKF
tara:strand:+ start:51 stop:437 length:387 start_codon:yes stop_codon:yes gene_type:complete